MSLVTRDDQERISGAITQAERRTSGEIVAVIVAESASYLSTPFLIAAATALLVPWPLIYLTWVTVQGIYTLQLLVFLCLVMALTPRRIRFRLVPRAILQSRAHRRAVEQFVARNLDTAAGRTGVLVFVSAAERYAEIIADAGLHEKIPQSAWQQIVDDLTTDIGAERAGDGLIKAINTVGDVLARHFPPDASVAHRLPDHLIVLD